MIDRLIRPEVPHVEVYVQNPDRSLTSASQMLADDVRADLNQTRSRITDAFKDNDKLIDDKGLESDINEYFTHKSWLLPANIVIDPDADAPLLNTLLAESAFPSIRGQEAYAGLNGNEPGVGCFPQLDLAFFHYSRNKYRKELLDVVRGWDCMISDEALEGATNHRLADVMVHELSHLAGGLAVSAVAVEKVDGNYNLAENSTAGFISIFDDIGIAEERPGDYAVGTALDESWAAFNASSFLLQHIGYDNREDMPLEYRFNVAADMKDDKGEEFYGGICSIHSGETGLIIERLDAVYTGIIDVMTQTADAKLSITDALEKIRATLPTETFTLLNAPRYSAWQRLLSESA